MLRELPLVLWSMNKVSSLKENNDNDFNTKSFCFIEIEKQENVQEIILENYDETMKNNIVK